MSNGNVKANPLANKEEAKEGKKKKSDKPRVVSSPTLLYKVVDENNTVIPNAKIQIVALTRNARQITDALVNDTAREIKAMHIESDAAKTEPAA